MRSRLSSDALDSSDVEPTRPDNGLPFRESSPLRPWHVHLELKPEQLLALHRLGFTGGALAWREGMDDWQPLRVGADVPEPAADTDPDPDPPLAQVTPLAEARRRSHRDSSNPPPPPGRTARITPFAQTRKSVPPIATALPMPLVRVRRISDRPPLPPIPSSAPLPSFAEDVAPALPESPREFVPRLVPLEPKPPSIPPMALESPEPARPKASRAMLLGAAALVALSASNGALVSALLWSLRNESDRTAPATAERAEHPAPPLGAAPAPAGAKPSSSDAAGPTSTNQPLSVEQLPLVNRWRSSGVNSSSSSSSEISSSTTGRGTRRKPAKVVLAEDGAPRATKAAEPASASGPPDRRAIARAVARAAGAASSCSPGPEKGRVSLTFASSGNVQGVSLLQGFGDAGVNSCVMRAMGRARVRPFDGEPITVQKTLNW